MNAFLNYDNLRLLNVPMAKPVYDEVLVEDCYRRKEVPEGSIVLDVGGFCGEFGVWCAANRACNVRIFEPSPAFEVAKLNAMINSVNVQVFNAAIGARQESRTFHYLPDHPAGSRLDGVGNTYSCVERQQTTLSRVQVLTLNGEINQALREVQNPDAPICIKLDCEGAEREIFGDESWLPRVHMVLLEFHYQDGPFYRKILSQHGFSQDTNEPNPEAWRGIIYAKRK